MSEKDLKEFIDGINSVKTQIQEMFKQFSYSDNKNKIKMADVPFLLDKIESVSGFDIEPFKQYLSSYFNISKTLVVFMKFDRKN